MNNKDFAKWQADRADSLHHQLFANQEWNRRLLETELRSQRWLAVLGVGGTLAGVFLGFCLQLDAPKKDNNPQTPQQANTQIQTNSNSSNQSNPKNP